MQNRILFLDYARVIAAFLVVFAHLYSTDSTVRLYIYAFHMPFFYLVSGILHKEVDDITILKKGIKSLLIPSFVYLTIGLFILSLANGNNIIDMAINTVQNFYKGEAMPANSIVWFLFSLLYVKIMSNFFIHHGHIIKSLIILLFLSFLVYPHWAEPFYFDTSLMALPFYLFGFYTKDLFINTNKQNKKWWIGVIFFLILTVCLTLINGRVSMVGCHYGIRRWPINVSLFYLNGIIGSMMLICLSFMFKKQMKACEIAALSLISIVGFQGIFIHFYSKHIGFNQNILMTILSTTIIIILCCILHALLKRYVPWAVGAKK